MSLYRNVAAESFQRPLASRGPLASLGPLASRGPLASHGLLTALVFVPASVPSGDAHLPLVFYRIQSNIDVTCSVCSLSVSKDKIRVKRMLDVK
jgi:hypothetical protein